MSNRLKTLDQMAKQVGKMLCVSPETGERLGIWNVSADCAIGLGTPDGTEFWILETILHESSEIEVKGLKSRNDWVPTVEKLSYAEQALKDNGRYLAGALLLLKENGIEVGSTELIAAADRVDTQSAGKEGDQ